MTEEQKLIERVKRESEQLWITIQEAKKSQLKVNVSFSENMIKPLIEVHKVLYTETDVFKPLFGEFEREILSL